MVGLRRIRREVQCREHLAEHEERVPHAARMEARFRLFEVTGDPAHLVEAKRLLDFALEHTPEEHREGMIANVALHRDFTMACKEHGG